MFQPAFQIIAIILTSFLCGLGVGWFLVGARKHHIEQKLQSELAGVKVNFQNVRESAHELRSQLMASEEQKAKVLAVLQATSGHKNFLKVRQHLEVARKYIQQQTIRLNQQEQEIFDLKDTEHVLRKHLALRAHQSRQVSLAQNNIVRLPVVAAKEDDLTLIKGVTPDIAYKLRNMGITSYRQIAECTPEQTASIQRLLGHNQPLPLPQWVIMANHLFHKKYGVLGDSCKKRQRSQSA